MKIAVIGAGVAGVSTAFELARSGHEVDVFERHGSVASEGSFAHAGLLSPSGVLPWAHATTPAQSLRQWLNRPSPHRTQMRFDPATFSWMLKRRRAWRASGLAVSRARLQRLALFSRTRLATLVDELQLDHERAMGHLVLLRTEAEVTAVAPALLQFEEAGIACSVLTPQQCLAVEPGLNVDTALAAGIYFPHEEVGNCREFTVLLRAHAQRLGVRFNFHSEARQLLPGRRPQLVHMHARDAIALTAAANAEAKSRAGPATAPMPMEPQTDAFDAIVVCAAMGTDALLRPHRLTLPLLPIWGHTVTAPMRHREAGLTSGPRAAVTDALHQVTINRLGQRLRITGGMEYGAMRSDQQQPAQERLYKALDDWFPGSAQMSQVQWWKGASPTLADGQPLLGPSGLDGIWLNIGHGRNGWTLACGSARLMAEMLGRQTPSIDIEGLGLERFRS
ncbi:MAG: hypothetical protein JWP52_1561 [Rhizobacter sp.]|nr:hypothetical protein [Rhizobacter sp.]